MPRRVTRQPREPEQSDTPFADHNDGFGDMDFRPPADDSEPAQPDPAPAPVRNTPVQPARPRRARAQKPAQDRVETAPQEPVQAEQPRRKRPAPVQEPAPQRQMLAEDNPVQANEAQKGGRRTIAHVVRKTRKPEAQDSTALSATQELEAIRAEGLTGRQLRIARRIAQRNGLNPASDLDAVRQLRKRGIDPFARENMLQLVAPTQPPAKQQGTEIAPQLPQTVPQPKGNKPAQKPAAPGAEVNVAREVHRIQRDIVRRRRKRGVLLFARLLFFVFLPTLFAGAYYYVFATPMYATNSQFVIQQAENQSAAGGLGGMFSGTMLATSQDAVTVQSYLQSRDAMLRLNRDLGFKEHFSSESIDTLQRLEAGASNEAAYKVYRRHVKIGFDPTEGIIKMEVIAADPQTSQAFSQALIGYAEEQVDNLTQRLRGDQMSGATDSYQASEQRMLEAQARVVALQEQRGVLSAEAEASSLMSQISTYEVELQNERLRLQELQTNANPNRTRVAVAQGNIARLDQTVNDLRARMTNNGMGGASLARVSSELMIAEQDLQTRTLMLQQSLQQLETARIEANRQVRYLSMGVRPIAPDEATYPRALENTFLAFMIFAGIYLMMSLTASILREQVSG